MITYVVDKRQGNGDVEHGDLINSLALDTFFARFYGFYIHYFS
jgi:hypothetical protein